MVSGCRFGARGGSLGTLEAVLGHAEAGRAPLLHEKNHAPVCTLFLSFRPPRGRKLGLYRDNGKENGNYHHGLICFRV